MDPPVPDDGKAYVPGATWRTASPSTLGLDPARVDALSRDVTARRYGAVDAVVLVRHGYVGLEQYVGWSPTASHTLQSVTKSVVSLLFGIARERHAPDVMDLDRPVLDIFTRYPDLQNVDARKRALTLRSLLMMRTDMDFWEQPYPGSPLDQLNRSSGDWLRFILDRPRTGQPGSDWAYNSGAAILTGGVIREIEGTNLDEFARRELFEPIGVASETWFRSPFDGLPHGGGGLSLKPLDLARVGYLVLRHGQLGDRVVVPRAWIDDATRPLTRPVPGFFTGFNPGYGHFWWLFPTTRNGSDAGIITGSGSGGQWLLVIPSLDLVVAIMAQDGAGLDLLYEGVLPAIARKDGARHGTGAPSGTTLAPSAGNPPIIWKRRRAEHDPPPRDST